MPQFPQVLCIIGCVCLLGAVSVCVLECCLGASVFCMFSEECVLPTFPTPITTCAPWVVQAWPGFAASPPHFSLAPPLTKHTARVHPMCLWVDALLPRLKRVYMMCSMHSPCPPPQSAPQRTRWAAPGSLLPYLPLPAVQPCALACVSVSLTCHVM